MKTAPLAWVAAFASLAALSAQAQAQVQVEAGAPMTGAEFEAEVGGQTLRYQWDGLEWGEEQYLPGRRVIWKPQGGDCTYGSWFEAPEGQICFSYDGRAPSCWLFFKGAQGVEVQSYPDPVDVPLQETGRSDLPLFCPGPQVGV